MKWQISATAPIEIIPATPDHAGGLQAVDYLLWALQRLYERGEDRYWEYVAEKVSLVHDVDDTRENEPEDEAWRESLPPELDEESDDSDASETKRHPLLQVATDFYMRLLDLVKETGEERSSHTGTLMHGAGKISGGLVQALSINEYGIDGLQRGLALVQLKRALRGVAFAKGALYPLHMEGRLSESDFEELQATLKQLDEGIFEHLSRIRDERASGW